MTNMQPRDRILEFYGAFARRVGGWIAIGTVIDLLGPVGVDEQAVRSAASRMKRNGLLVPNKVRGVAGYALSDTAAAVLEDGDARIFGDGGDATENGWAIAVFSVPEAQRSNRYLIRSRLSQLGFGQTAPGVWIAPAAILGEAQRVIARTDLAAYVTFWRGDPAGSRDLSAVVAQAWDLRAIKAGYERYIESFNALVRSDTPNRADTEVFVDYLNNLASWRPLSYADPGLPADLVPDVWPGPEARELFHRLDTQLRPGAQRAFDEAATALP